MMIEDQIEQFATLMGWVFVEHEYDVGIDGKSSVRRVIYADMRRKQYISVNFEETVEF